MNKIISLTGLFIFAFLLFIIPLTSALYLDVDNIIYDGTYEYRVNTGFLLDDLEVTDNEFYLNNISFCSSPYKNNFNYTRDCSDAPVVETSSPRSSTSSSAPVENIIETINVGFDDSGESDLEYTNLSQFDLKSMSNNSVEPSLREDLEATETELTQFQKLLRENIEGISTFLSILLLFGLFIIVQGINKTRLKYKHQVKIDVKTFGENKK